MSDSSQNMSAHGNTVLRLVRTVRLLLGAACFALLIAGAASATSYTYVGLAPAGQSNDWSNSQNWSPNGVPGASDEATIDGASSSVFPKLTSGVFIKNLTIKNGASITGGQVTVSGTLTMLGGGFVSTQVFADGGMLIGSGTGGSGFASLRGATLINRGGEQSPAKLSSGGLTLLQNGGDSASFINEGHFHVGGGANINRPANDTSEFINHGTFRSDPNQIGTSLGTITAGKNAVFFSSDGLVNIEAGLLTFDAVVTNSKEFRTNSSPQLDASIKIAPSGVLNLASGASLTGSGVTEVNGTCVLLGQASAETFRLKSVTGQGVATLTNDNTSAEHVGLSINALEWQGGVIKQIGVLRINTDFAVSVATTLNISGVNVLERALVINNGTANFPTSAQITGNRATFNNAGRMNLTGGKFITNSAFGFSEFSNGTTGVISSFGETIFGWFLMNDGNVETQQGTLTLTDYVRSSGRFTTPKDTIIDFKGDADFNEGTRLEGAAFLGAGLFRATGSGFINVNGNVTVTSFELNGSSKTMTGTTNSRLLVSTLFEWKAGNLNCSPAGQIRLIGIAAGAMLNISGDTSKTNTGCVIDNAGLAVVTTTARFTMDKGAVMNNLNGAVFNFSSPVNQGVFNENAPIPIFNNAGTVNWGGGSTSPTFSFPFYNQSGGTTNVAPGITLDFYNGSTFNGDFNLGNNGTVRSNNNKPIELKSGHLTTGGIGTIVSPGGFNNTEFFIDIDGNEPGLINLNGAYNAGNGTLEIDIRGTGAGTQYDQFNVSGNATLGGTVNVDLQSGFVPQTGSTFQLLPYGSHTGTFPRINGLNNIGNNRLFLPKYTNTSFLLFTSPMNSSQNGPVINSAVSNADGTLIQGTFSGAANTTYTISIFTSPTGLVSTCDNANQTLIGSTIVFINSPGSGNFMTTLATALPVGQFVTGIATDSSDTSSKFSACAQVTAGSDTVQFIVANQSAGEADGSVTVAVTRSGGNSATASVDYSTSDGTASDRSDYSATIGKLIFAAGETTKSVKVLLADDAYAEGAETFTVTLSNPTGGLIIGAQPTATVTINDNDAVTGPNPLDNAQFFVRQHYADFLNREPDNSGLQFWTGQVTNCGNPNLEVCRINVSAAFFQSIEFQQTGYFVYRTYGAAFGTRRVGAAVPLTLREFLPDTQQIGAGIVVNSPAWEQQLEANKVAYFNDFVSRAAFTSAYPLTLTAPQFVDALNTNASGALSQSERDQLVADLAGGAKTRAQVLRAVAEDPDFVAAERNRAFVLMQYFGYLRRNPNDPPEANLDFAGYNFWLGKLNQFGGNFINAEMVKAFITSNEYRKRFGP